MNGRMRNSFVGVKPFKGFKPHAFMKVSDKTERPLSESTSCERG